ncbi:MAG: hypothetical protein ACTS27_08750 [Phycisphaerales bacterium]
MQPTRRKRRGGDEPNVEAPDLLPFQHRKPASRLRPRRTAMHSIVTPAFCALALAFAAHRASGLDHVPEFAAINIGAQLDENGGLSFARALNEDGDAVGDILLNSSQTKAFVYTYEHGAVLLPLVPGHATATAVDVSERDEDGVIIIVGRVGFGSLDPTQPTGQAAIWRYSTRTNAVLDSFVFGPISGYPFATALAVTNAGKALGVSRTGPMIGGPAPQGMLYDINTGVLSPVSFPVVPTDINNNDVLAGGTWVGPLGGAAVDLGIPDGTATASISRINDLGHTIATVRFPYTDGAGRFVAGAAKHTDTWEVLWNNSAFDTGFDLNEHGDAVGLLGISAAIRPALFIEALGSVHLINNLISPTTPLTISYVGGINSHGQIAGGVPASILTPLGVMIIPGDVNGDAEVNLDDLCAWLAEPVDLDDDGDADFDDELWLRARLMDLGFVIGDCNGNGVPDHCDILSGASADCNANGVPDECEPDCDSDGIPDACESDCNGNGIPDDCDIAGGLSSDCNGNGIPDECDDSDTVFRLREYAAPPLLQPASVFVDELFVADEGELQDVNLTLDIDYRIGDLVVRLSHAGVTVALVDRPGFPANPSGNGQLGYRITLDDEGAGPFIESVGNFGSPFEPIVSPPSYRPHSPLSAFDGLPRAGVWAIEIETFGPSPLNQLLSWGLELTDTAVDVNPCGCPGDTNGDNVVNFADLNAVLSEFGTVGAPGFTGADVTADGAVNFADLNAVLSAFGTACD